MTLMTPLEIKKSEFVAKLSVLFSDNDLYDVANMVYMTIPPFEKVVITFKSGGSTSANVTWDSHRAILDDILKALKRYEEMGE